MLAMPDQLSSVTWDSPYRYYRIGSNVGFPAVISAWRPASNGRLATNKSIALRPVFASRPAPLEQEIPTASRLAYAHEHPLREESVAAE
jgi:hypothetical protein